MPYTVDTEIDLTRQANSNYIISSQHRKQGNPNKSIWTISFDNEVGCFIQAINQDWKSGTKAWGIWVLNNALQSVGINNYGQELKLAKFVDGTNTNVWHGYPADYLQNSQDRPTTNILKSWVKNGYITKAKMSKIRLGQSCSL